MIFDCIENAHLYRVLGSRIGQAFNYIQATDFSRLAPGRYDIDGEDLFAMVNAYETKDRRDCELEGHRQYIDLQYMVEGAELIGYAPLRDQAASLISGPEEDCLFYQGEASFVLLDQGMFALLFPADLHMPCVRTGHARVKKVVVKIRV